MFTRKRKLSSRFVDLSGQAFGRLTVVQKDDTRKGTYFICKCECGEERSVAASNLHKGATRSCGCYNDENRIKVNTTHGGRYLPEYRVWNGMIARCENPKQERYPRYGGRGIKVCEDWRHSFEAFLAYVGRRPSASHSIDRIDTDGDYEPGNVKWSSASEQAANKTCNVWVNFQGKRMIAVEAAKASGISYKLLMFRIYNWPEERWFTAPRKSPRKA